VSRRSASCDTIINESRRAFVLGVGAGGLVLALGPRLVEAQEAKKYGGDAIANGMRDDPRVFVAIAEDGTVTIVCHRSEMGQGVRTSVAMVIADELEADWSRVKVVQAPGDEARFGSQNTIASRSLRHGFAPLRRAGAAARTMLEAAAAASWGVPLSEVKAQNHEVVHASTARRLGYGTLAKRASEQPVPPAAQLKLKPPTEFRYIGQAQTKPIDDADIVGGRAHYGIDTRLDEMLYAVIARPPVYGGKVAWFDASETRKVPGVLEVLALYSPAVPVGTQPLGGVAVVATNTWAAIKGREQLRIRWDDGVNASYDSSTYRTELEAAARGPGAVVRNEGDVDKALASAAKRVSAEYYIPHLSHAPMEPPCAVARVVDGACEVWACTQDPQSARNLLAKLLGLPTERVTVNVTLLGGGFGRKSRPDFIVEAALVSRTIAGKPVKLTWTREDDLVNDYFHTVSVEHLEAGLDESRKTVAWLHRTVAPTIGSLGSASDPQHELSFELGMGVTDLPFAIPSIRLENPAAAAHTRISWFRGVSNIPHAFAIQSFVAELATAAGRDHKDFLLELLGPPRTIDPATLGDKNNTGEDPKIYPVDISRWRRVIETVAKEAGWGRTLPKGQGLGIAAHRCELSYAAVVVEAHVGTDGKLAIPRVDIAVDCGPQVNPERVRAQMESGVVWGVSLAMLGEITFKKGRAQQTNFHQYRVARNTQAPREIHVHPVAADDFTQPLGGVGEVGVPPVAPALANAIFAATGQRLRTLPFGDPLPTGKTTKSRSA
jgi:isoquinoline 1-oxidoreductase beta subunit